MRTARIIPTAQMKPELLSSLCVAFARILDCNQMRDKCTFSRVSPICAEAVCAANIFVGQATLHRTESHLACLPAQAENMDLRCILDPLEIAQARSSTVLVRASRTSLHNLELCAFAS